MQRVPAEQSPMLLVAHGLRAPLGQLQVFIVLAVVLGGGGVGAGMFNLAVQLGALLLLFLQYRAVRRFLADGPRMLVILALVTLTLPLLQLVPLPPAIWQALPGRALVSETYAIAGIPQDSWFPLSLDRGRTLTAFLSLIPPFAVLAIGATLGGEAKARLARTVSYAALAVLAWGMLQLASGNSFGMYLSFEHKDNVLYASFVNRNSTAALFAISLVLLVVVPPSNSSAGRLGTAAGAALLALGIVLTQSRSGMVLGAMALGMVLLRAVMITIARRHTGPSFGSSGWLIALGAAILAVSALSASVVYGGRAADAFNRFDDTETNRPEIWEDGAYAAQQYWPIGSGAGTFDEVFQLHESLEYITPRRAGWAHNDWLQVGIESGLVGAGLVLIWLLWCAQAALRAPAYWRWPAWGAGTGVLALAAQSLLDYPLRTETMLCVAAVLAAMLARRREKPA